MITRVEAQKLNDEIRELKRENAILRKERDELKDELNEYIDGRIVRTSAGNKVVRLLDRCDDGSSPTLGPRYRATILYDASDYEKHGTECHVYARGWAPVDAKWILDCRAMFDEVAEAILKRDGLDEGVTVKEEIDGWMHPDAD